ncbi:MAG: hypothetical protein MJ126_05820 [Lachnospiraceae bacterium]|nr:hypothetical protein [Lachnospiraceae bacterium]
MTRPTNEEVYELALQKMRYNGINVDYYIGIATRDLYDCYYDDVQSDME